MKTTQPIRNPAEVSRLFAYLRGSNQPRNYLLVVLSVCTALRISDILNLNCNDVYNFANDRVHTTLTITEQKTKKSKIIALNNSVVSALKVYWPQASLNTPLLVNARTGRAITRVQAYRIIRKAANAAGIENNVSCHSLRKTFGYHALQNGVCPTVIMNIYNHSSMVVTQRYLGLTQDHINSAYAAMEFDNL